MIKIITILVTLICFIESFRLAMICLRNDIPIYIKITESLILIIMIIFSYFNIHYENKIVLVLSIILSSYILVKFVKGIIKKSDYIDELSIKNAIDLSNSGIMFLDDKKRIIIKNRVMDEILDSLKIDDDYLNNLMKSSFKKIDNNYLIKDKDIIWKLVTHNNKEIILYDVCKIYNLNEQYIKENKKIEKNNNKLMNLMNNIEKIEETKNLLQIKNEYHDILGHRLALINKYMESDKYNVKDIEFLLDCIYNENNELSPKNKLTNLIKMYNIVGININLNGKLTNNMKIDEILFEIIREAITNAIIHANSDLIDINIKDGSKNVIVSIENDGKFNNKVIKENDGIKGMKRKLKEINGKLDIIVDTKFKLIIDIKK